MPKPTQSRHGRSSPQKAPYARLLMPVIVTMQDPNPHGIEGTCRNAKGKPNASTQSMPTRSWEKLQVVEKEKGAAVHASMNS